MRARYFLYTLITAALVSPGWLAAAESANRIDLIAVNKAPSDIFASVRVLGLGSHDLHIDDVVAKRTPPTMTVFLQQAGLTETRQALAHAVGLWWYSDLDAATPVTWYRSTPVPQIGAISTRTYTSSLVNNFTIERTVVAAIAPWLAPKQAGLALDVSSGNWVASLDSEGHRRFMVLLSYLEHGEAACPSALPLGAGLPLTAATQAPIQSTSWNDCARQLALSTKVSIALAPVLPPTPKSIQLQAGSVPILMDQLRLYGLHSSWINGVWCWGPAAPIDRESPVQRSRFALLTMPSGVRTDTDIALLTACIQRQVNPTVWTQPGYCLEALHHATYLLVSGDVWTIHKVWTLLDRIEASDLETVITTTVAGER